MEVWQGSVTLGMTVCAVSEAAPSARSRSIVGVSACTMPSGRIPSIETSITVVSAAIEPPFSSTQSVLDRINGMNRISRTP
jgi:hypothetical protein